jgi:glycosyltransferase involved in cell wall biosynthesis
MKRPDKPRALLVAIRKGRERPWWWQHLDHGSLRGDFEFEPVVIAGGRPKGLLTREFLSMWAQCVSILWRARRRRVQYIFTFECDWLSFIIALVQTVLLQRRPRHVILQFIMREKTGSLASRLKYAFMKWCFSSVYLCVCSARRECDYYARVFGWPAGKLGYVPLHTDPGFLSRARAPQEGFVLAAGRTLRDYPTLLEAFRGMDIPLKIVASPANIGGAAIPANVTVAYDRPIAELIDLISRSMIVVVPLEERQISIGQSVVLEAMTMGKAVIVTEVNGTVDYIDHMRTGILVPPRDPQAIRDAVERLAADPALRQRLGEAALREIHQRFLPSHYAEGVSDLLCGRRAVERAAHFEGRTT